MYIRIFINWNCNVNYKANLLCIATHRWKRITTATLALIFNRRHGALCSIIEWIGHRCASTISWPGSQWYAPICKRLSLGSRLWVCARSMSVSRFEVVVTLKITICLLAANYMWLCASAVLTRTGAHASHLHPGLRYGMDTVPLLSFCRIAVEFLHCPSKTFITENSWSNIWTELNNTIMIHY